MIRLAVIGAGLRASQMLATMRKVDSDVRVVAIADPNIDCAKKALAENGAPADDAVYYPNVDVLLENADQLDGLLIGTRCNLHTPIAIKVAPTGLPLFLEKPVGISMEQLTALHNAFIGRTSSVVVSFPLRITPLFKQVLEIVRSGRLGNINQIFAYNFVSYGGVYFGEWYRDFQTTGGLWLQKATHDFDYINLLARSDPISIVATETQKVYGGEMPENLRCSNCDRTNTCPESPVHLKARNDGGGMNLDDHWCAFSNSIHHHDSASALINYADGMHASYTQNFITRRSAAWRGARITGYEATLEFNWITDTLKLIEHHGTAVEEIKVTTTENHSGGDTELARHFLAVTRGEEQSQSTLTDGIKSAAMCLAAQTSAQTQTFQNIEIARFCNHKT